MFQDSLMESVVHSPARRGKMTLLGMVLQLMALSAVLLYPLLHPAALPSLLAIHEPAIPIVSPAPVPEPRRENRSAIASNQVPVAALRIFTQPSVIPTQTYTGPDTAPPQVFGSGSTCHEGCTGMGIAVLGNNSPPVLAAAKPRMISHLDAGQIISRVEPVYPAIAKATRTQGTVVLHAIIGRDGKIENLRLVTGNQLLNQAALQAVSQWKFRPYVLNGTPIEVETEIMINFKLSE